MQLLHHPAVKAGIITVLAIGLIHLLSALTLDRTLQYWEISYLSPKVSEALAGYRIAFLTDIHNYPQAKLTAMVEQLNARGVDLVVLGGDFGKQRNSILDSLAQIEARDGIWGVAGNHDNAAQLAGAMEARGMHFLANAGAAPTPGLYLAGLEDLWTGDPDVAAALAQAGAEDFVLLAAHNPDTSVERDYTGVDLALSGHVHGGEVTLFGLWGPAMSLVSSYGQRFRTGLCTSEAGTDVLISHGVGNHSPLRVFARPQVLLITLEAPL